MVYSDNGIEEKIKTDRNFDQINELMKDWKDTAEFHDHDIRVYVEQVSAFSGQGVTSSFTFGTAFGRVLQSALLTGTEPILVRPQVWQKYWGLIVKGEKLTQTQKKNRNKDCACKLAQQPLTHAFADAYLIARYGYDNWNSAISENVRKATPKKRRKTSSG